MTEGDEYKEIIAEFIQNQMAILGPKVAVDFASQINGLVIDDFAKVKEFTGSPKEILRNLELKFTELTGDNAHKELDAILARNPLIEKSYREE